MTTKNTTKSGMKSYVSNMVIHIGPATISGRLVGVRKPADPESKTKLVAPTGESVRQVYQTPAGEIYQRADLESAKIDENDAAAILDAEALKAASTSALPKDIMNVTVCSLEDVENSTYASDNNAYVFYPSEGDPSNKIQADGLAYAIARGNMAFVAIMNLRNHEGLYRLSSWRGHIILQKLLYPEMLNPHETVVLDESTTNKKIAMLLESLSVGFDPDDYRDQIARAKQAVADAAEAGEVIVIEKAAPTAVFDLDAFAAAFEAAK